MTLDDVILRSTIKPAKAICRTDLGHLSVGAEADVAVLAIRKGDFGFVDSGHARLRGDKKFESIMTVRNGRIVWDPNGLSWPDWETAGLYEVLSH